VNTPGTLELLPRLRTRHALLFHITETRQETTWPPLHRWLSEFPPYFIAKAYESTTFDSAEFPIFSDCLFCSFFHFLGPRAKLSHLVQFKPPTQFINPFSIACMRSQIVTAYGSTSFTISQKVTSFKLHDGSMSLGVYLLLFSCFRLFDLSCLPVFLRFGLKTGNCF
jgi:hypothetical protein